MKIDTIQQYLDWRKNTEPLYLESKKAGKIDIACMQTLLIKRELVIPNTWNPNHVTSSKMDQLEDSIIMSGFCFPSVVYYDEVLETFVISDGFHRYKIGGSEYLDLEYVPCVVRDYDENQRVIATMQFNKAKGTHQVDLDAEVIRKLIEQGMSDEDIAKRLAISTDEVYRYKQLTGISELFKNAEYSLSWEME